MSQVIERPSRVKAVHGWLRTIRLAYVPGPTTPMVDTVAEELLDRFRERGHSVQAEPDSSTDVILTTAGFGVPMPWRQALLFSARRRFGIDHSPTVVTLVHATPQDVQAMLDRLEAALAREPLDPADFEFPGLAPTAHRVLVEQGRRGGPMLSLLRVLQSQVKCLRIVLVVGRDRPEQAYHFDLVGAHPRSEADDPSAFYDDIVLRIVTAASTREVTDHEVRPDVVPRATWASLQTPEAMRHAGQQLGERNFFTEMVRIADLVHVPAVGAAVAAQYSEGCFATWEPRLPALIATITGSARPVDKGNITDDDLAVVVGVRPGASGAIVRHVEGKRNDSPSSEAVELMEMDSALPRTTLGEGFDFQDSVPVLRSKLHGHRAIAAYDARLVEYVPLDLPYYYYPVSCATGAQAQGIKQAFARAESVRLPDDPRQVVFTVLPGHGVVIGEKWVAGKAPFQVMWECMDAGALEVANRIPQGLMEFAPGPDGRMHLREP
ncbi:MAG TPA: hypothetical protein VGA32_06870 [Anaerolineales bacterium]